MTSPSLDVAPDPVSLPDSGVTIAIEADPTTGLAAIQNLVPLVRSIRIHNGTDEELRDLVLRVGSAPLFAQPKRIRFDRLMPGESRLLSTIDLSPERGFFHQASEAIRGQLSACLLQGERELTVAAHEIEVLAYDQWAGTRALPELIAAFSMPNNPAVDRLLGKASTLLRSQFADLSMNGYQSKNREVVWKQVSAIYSTIAAENLQYAEPPASFGSDGQKIRTPDRILDGKVATCLDLVMLFASCFEQAGLRPVVLLKEGHAWVGVWLHAARFSSAAVDDVQAIRKRVGTGELIAFETTAVAQHASVRPSLRLALEHGQRLLRDDEAFRLAIDVQRARELNILPLPSRATLEGTATDDSATPAGVEPTPVLPPFEPDDPIEIEGPVADTPEGRLAKWKSRLLDLSLRNRLLNFKPTKATLTIVAPDPEALENAVADGVEFRMSAAPVMMDGQDGRSDALHVIRTGTSALEETARKSLAERELIAKVSERSLQDHLLAIHSTARTGLEEGGANTLYLAFGLLRWTDGDRSAQTWLAPILLIPVVLTRQSVRSGYRLSRHDDEPVVNPTLLQLLESKFGLSITGLAAADREARGVNVTGLLQKFRLAVREIPQWEVLDEVHLGLFSFTKYLMWRDLQDRTEQLKANRVVRHLIENPGKAFPDDRLPGEDRPFDERYQPQDLLAPLLADSSQLGSLSVVDSGRDLVLEGPPGTGKSQTITNLIAHSLAKGRTVLFVSEKMAALEVVRRRLVQIGLGAFCLELHSAKAKKSEVLQQLGEALKIASARSSEDWQREATRLAKLRGELNALVDALHHVHPNGLTVFDATGTVIRHAGTRPSLIPWTDPGMHDRAALEALREAVRKLDAMGGALRTVRDHPLASIGKAGWSPGWQGSLLEAVESTRAAGARLTTALQSLDRVFCVVPRGQSLATLGALDVLADVMLQAPKVPAGLAGHAHDEAARAELRLAAKFGAERQHHWARLAGGWEGELARQDAAQLRDRWVAARSAWWPKSWFATGAVRRQLAALRKDLRRPGIEEMDEMLPELGRVNECDRQLANLQIRCQQLLQDSFMGVVTDWNQIGRAEAWAQTFSEAVSRVAGLDSDWRVRLRDTLRPLVSTERGLLSPGAKVGRALVEYRDSYAELTRQLAHVQKLAESLEPLAGSLEADGALERIAARLDGWSASKASLMPWCNWRASRAEAITLGLQGVVSSLEEGAVAFGELADHFEYSYRDWWLKGIVDRMPILSGFSSADHERKIREFREADERFQKLTEAYIAAVLGGKVPSTTAATLAADSEMGTLRRELQRQRMHLPVRQLVQKLPTLLPRLKPCLLMSPLSVTQYLAAGHSQFDLVVFDEASQIPTWDAVGAIARGRQLVVVGDPKQLPPTSFFAKSGDGDGAAANSEEVEELESILDECLGAGMNRQSLAWHYRSRHESLITFSNHRYYESRLVTFPSPATQDTGVTFQRVAGVYDRGGSRTNRAEAEAIVDAIERHFTSAECTGRSLGVVTFNQTQQVLIETLLDARRRERPELDKTLAKDTGEPLFIKNLENVQGDERDIILFSITYGPDQAGRTSMNFGPLNGEGGHRRLNVAISRAREQVVVYSSLLPEQIDVSKTSAQGVRDLKHYLDFALRGTRAIAEQSLPTGLEPESPFELSVLRVLRDKGWVVHPQVGCSGYRIDLAVVDPGAPGRYLVGIECDGRSYHSGATARDRDRLRQLVLEGLGWRIHRIWSTDWWLDAAGETARIVEKLEAWAKEAAEQREAAAAEVKDVSFGSTEPGAGAPSGKIFRSDLFDAGGPEQAPVATSRASADRSSPPADVSAAQVPALAVQRIYQRAELPISPPAGFYDWANGTRVAAQLRTVLEAEGPVLEELLFNRVARAWSLERTGSRIRERLRHLLPVDMTTTQEDDRTFCWPPGMMPDQWTDFRVAGPGTDSRRVIGEVCIQEISLIVLEILSSSGATSRSELPRPVCRVIGMSRLGADADRLVDAAVDRLQKLGRVQVRDGYVLAVDR